MKTKTLLIAAAALAAGVMSSQAQVYSQNIVGYVNLAVTNGYHLYANPLDLDGTGTNNTVTTVLGTNLPAGSQVLSWNGSTFDVNSFSIPSRQTVPIWSNPNAPLNPGTGFFIYNAGAATNITIVGTALVGTNLNSNLTPGGGYYAISSITPIAGNIQTNLDYQPTVGDQILLWDDAIQTYDIYSYSIPARQTVPVWGPSSPNLNVGQGFFLNTANTDPSWTEIFNPE